MQLGGITYILLNIRYSLGMDGLSRKMRNGNRSISSRNSRLSQSSEQADISEGSMKRLGLLLTVRLGT
jgi:hypothetical protein